MLDPAIVLPDKLGSTKRWIAGVSMKPLEWLCRLE